MRILFVLSRFPVPAQTGDRLRALHQIEHLAAHHEVHVLCLSDIEPPARDMATLEALVESLQVIPHGRGRIARNLAGLMMGDLPIQTQMFQSDALASAVRELLDADAIDVVVSQLARISPNVGNPAVPHVLDFVDALSLGLERRSKSSALPARVLLGIEAKRMKRLEARSGRNADQRVVTSPVDAAHLEAMGMGPVHVVPVGVSDDFFESRPVDESSTLDFDVLFTGNLGYAANVVACEFLVNDVLPRIVERIPDVRLGLIGARPAKRVQRLRSDRVHVEGPVEDLRPFFRRTQLAIAPMRIGSGIQLKLLEAMAMGVPTVTTPLANTALRAIDRRDLVLGATAVELADAVCSILDDPTRGRQIGLNGQKFVSEHYRWARLNADFEAILTSAVTR